MAELDRYARHTRDLRAVELEIVLRHFKKSPSRVLEIGAGSGWHAKLMAESGHIVEAIDVAPWPESAHPVLGYDGRNIPFKDNSFDVVFSSSVLEHISDIGRIESEIARVLDEDGIAIHIVPTPTWRILTTLSYYPALPWVIASVLRQLKGQRTSTSAETGGGVTLHQADTSTAGASLRRLLKWGGTLAVSPRHGERGNRFSEAFYFRGVWWETHFSTAGFEVFAVEPSGLFYGGNSLFGGLLSLPVRRWLGCIFGSSSRIYVMRKR